MVALQALWAVVKDNLLKVIIIFVCSGVVGVLGLVPGTENVSNIVGAQITSMRGCQKECVSRFL